MSEQDRPPLLIAKGAFKAMGGAEMDLIRVLPAMNRVFDVTWRQYSLRKSSS